MSPRVILALLGLVGVLLVSALVYALVTREPAPSDLSWRVQGYEVGDPDRLRVTIVVDKPPAATARCQIAAFTAESRSAGRLDGILVAPRADGSRLTELTVVVPTERPATSAQISQCVLTDGSG